MHDTPKQFVLQLGALVSAYVALVAFLLLGFSVIDLIIPDAIESYWEVASAGDSARMAIAILVVATPTMLFLTAQIQRLRTKTDQSDYAPLVRWLIYLSVFIGSAVLLGYVVGIITQFLNGELTIRFILKALLAGAVIGAAMWYYLKDTQGYWKQHPTRLQQAGWIVLGTTTALILFSFTLIDSPATVREVRIDQDQIDALRDVEWRIENHLGSKQSLPEDIAELYPDGNVPSAPRGREAYSFDFTDSSYELCATFHEANPELDTPQRPQPRDVFEQDSGAFRIDDYNTWNYEVGRHCFARSVSFSTSTESGR